jgi:hypothetical protein
MATAFTFKIDARDADFVAQSLRNMPNQIPKVMAQAINRALPGTRKVITAGLKDATTIRKKSRIIKGTNVKKATASNLTGKITFDGRTIGAIEFEHTANKTAGVAFRLMPADTPIRMRHGFRGTGAGGNKHLFQRVRGSYYKVGSRAHYKPNVGRRTERIESFKGPSLRTIYDRNPAIDRAAHAAADAIVKKNIAASLKFFLSRKQAV